MRLTLFAVRNGERFGNISVRTTSILLGYDMRYFSYDDQCFFKHIWTSWRLLLFGFICVLYFLSIIVSMSAGLVAFDFFFYHSNEARLFIPILISQSSKMVSAELE